MRNHLRLVPALTALAAVAACGTTGQQPLNPTAQSTDDGLTGSGSRTDVTAPHVAEPIDVSRFLRQPCAVLSSQQIGSLGNDGRPAQSDGAGSGPSCPWQNSTDGSVIRFVFATVNKQGLTDYYRAKATYPPSFFGYFETTTVDGYPAIYNSATDDRKDGTCNISVGVTDKLSFSAGLEGGKNGTQSCVVTKRIASEALTTMKGAG